MLSINRSVEFSYINWSPLMERGCGLWRRIYFIIQAWAEFQSTHWRSPGASNLSVDRVFSSVTNKQALHHLSFAFSVMSSWSKVSIGLSGDCQMRGIYMPWQKGEIIFLPKQPVSQALLSCKGHFLPPTSWKQVEGFCLLSFPHLGYQQRLLLCRAHLEPMWIKAAY